MIKAQEGGHKMAPFFFIVLNLKFEIRKISGAKPFDYPLLGGAGVGQLSQQISQHLKTYILYEV